MAYTRDTMPTVPPGKVRIADCGTYPRELDADRTVIEKAIGALHSYPTVTLAHITRGYVIAGSCMRWNEAVWSVSYTVPDGGIHGKLFRGDDEASAREYFAKLTNPEAVAARRTEDEILETTVYGPAREQRQRETAERLAADKARKATMRRARRMVTQK